MWQEVLGGIEGSQLGCIINPRQWFSSFFWCIHPQGPITMPCPPTAACAVSIRLSQSSVADPSEIACGAQSEPRSENRVPAPVGCGPPEERQGAGEGGRLPRPGSAPTAGAGIPRGKTQLTPQLACPGASFCPRFCCSSNFAGDIRGKKALFSPLKLVRNSYIARNLVYIDHSADSIGTTIQKCKPQTIPLLQLFATKGLKPN